MLASSSSVYIITSQQTAKHTLITTPIQIRLLNWRRQDIVCAGLTGIQAQIKFIRNLITCLTVVPGVSQIRTCRLALSKHTLGQLCNHTFLDPCCHALFSSIPEVLPLSSGTPCIEFLIARKFTLAPANDERSVSTTASFIATFPTDS
jgi:hypothetical protein